MKFDLGLKGNFNDVYRYIKNLNKNATSFDFESYAKRGLDALKAATPVDTGLTANSWYYEIEITDTQTIIQYYNSNVIKDYANIAILLQYGHNTKNGGWVQGRDYINPAIQPIFDEIAETAWKKVKDS